MTEYIDYSYYCEEAHKKLISEADFPGAALRASVFIKYLTFGRVADSFETDYPQYIDEIKLATCEVAEVLYQAEKRKSKHGGLEVASENNDGYSVSYLSQTANGSPQTRVSFEENMAMKAAYPYLIDTGLLYLGVNGHAD